MNIPDLRRRMLGCVLLAAMSASAATNDPVKIDAGSLQGAVEGDVAYFKGIPFAAPPVGALRWQPPQPVTPWRGVRQATQYGNDCMQLPAPGDAAPLGVGVDEDCLYLNVWRPAHSAASKLPVMVWIYGGGFVNGGSSPAVYDGSEFARSGVVLVSINYRVGRFGFFAHPALSAEQPGSPPVSYGLLDQVAGLKWVKKNIAAFGGDPGNITLFGESAGGMSVFTMLTSPLAEGLFHKAIIESGGGRGVFAPRVLRGTPDSAEAVGVAFAKKHGIEGEDAAALAKLRALPPAAIVDGLNMWSMAADRAYVGGPTVADGRLVTGMPVDVFAAGKGMRVPVIIGATSMDLGFSQAKTMDELFAQFGARADEARKIYNPLNSSEVNKIGLVVAGDQTMAEPARQVARLLSARGQPTYLFRFSYVAESMRAKSPGATHASEIPFVFNTVAARYGKELTEKDRAAARVAHQYWVAFARTGKPDFDGLPKWPAYTAQTDILMDFTNEGPVAGPDTRKIRMDLAESVHSSR